MARTIKDSGNYQLILGPVHALVHLRDVQMIAVIVEKEMTAQVE